MLEQPAPLAPRVELLEPQVLLEQLELQDQLVQQAQLEHKVYKVYKVYKGLKGTLEHKVLV
jgi:hypothetical protein